MIRNYFGRKTNVVLIWKLYWNSYLNIFSLLCCQENPALSVAIKTCKNCTSDSVREKFLQEACECQITDTQQPVTALHICVFPNGCVHQHSITLIERNVLVSWCRNSKHFQDEEFVRAQLLAFVHPNRCWYVCESDSGEKLRH